MLGIIVVCCLFCCWKLFRHHSGVKDCVQDTVPHMDRDSTSRTSGGKKQTGTFPSIRASMLTYSIWKYMKTYEDMWRYVKIYEGVRVKSRTPWLFASQECYQSNWNVTHVQASCSAGYSYGRDKAVLVATPLKTLMLKSLKNVRFEDEFPWISHQKFQLLQHSQVRISWRSPAVETAQLSCSCSSSCCSSTASKWRPASNASEPWRVTWNPIWSCMICPNYCCINQLKSRWIHVKSC